MDTQVEEINLASLVDVFTPVALPVLQEEGQVTAAAPSVRTKIENLEAEMLKMPQVDCPLEHHFAPGLYARQITIPAGTMLTGKIHKHDDINVVLSGEIDVLTPFGFKRMRGPCTFVARAGTKKLGYAHTDTVWTTIHANPTDETDIDKLELLLVHNEREDAYLIESSAAQHLLEGETVCQS
jgi:hypothetical protein